MGLECVLQRFYRSTRFRLTPSLRRYSETGTIETVTVSPVSALCGRGLSPTNNVEFWVKSWAHCSLFVSKTDGFKAPSTRSRFHGETAKVLYGSAFRPHEAGESADRNRKLLKQPSEVVSNLSGFVLVSCGRLKPTETANHDVIAPPLDLLANGS